VVFILFFHFVTLSWCINFCHDLVKMHQFHEHVWNCYIEWEPSFLVYLCIVTYKIGKDEVHFYTFKVFNLNNLCHATRGLWVSATKLICATILGFNLQAYQIDNIYICPFTVSCGCHKCKPTSPVLEITVWISYQAMYKLDNVFSSVH